MVNTRRDTPLLINSYNSRGLIINNASSNNCVRLPDGTLYAVIGVRWGDIHLYSSSDDGFSWSLVRDDVETSANVREVAGLFNDGLEAHLVIDETFRILDIFMGVFDGVSQYDIDRSRYDLDDLTAAPTSSAIITNISEGDVDVVHNHEEIFATVITGAADIAVYRCSPASTSVSSATTHATTAGRFNTVCDENGNLDIVFEDDSGATYTVDHIRYNSKTPSFGSETTIVDMGDTSHEAKDMQIARDGYGTLCVFYAEDDGSSALTLKYAISTDSGSTWSVTSLTRTSGHSIYNDSITSDRTGRCKLLGGREGFLLSYVEDDSSNVPKTYVRKLATSDGTTYTLGSEQEIAKNNTQTTDSIVGLSFFKPTDTKLMDLSDPGLVRAAYCIGEGNSTVFNDTVPVSFGQELLEDSTYPSALASDAGSYQIDTTDSKSLIVNVEVIAGPNIDQDWYKSGLTGSTTQKYLRAINRAGTSLRLLRYQPVSTNEMNDRSAYGAPEEFSVLCLFDPLAYSFPTPSLSTSNQQDFVEQDTRKIYLPPNFPLQRTFLVNAGGYLKRTVWLAEFGNNLYELSQVVPRFFNGQICYYEANAYVVGPSRDPFSRTILPSET